MPPLSSLTIRQRRRRCRRHHRRRESAPSKKIWKLSRPVNELSTSLPRNAPVGWNMDGRRLFALAYEGAIEDSPQCVLCFAFTSASFLVRYTMVCDE